jgi:hypothetical protein
MRAISSGGKSGLDKAWQALAYPDGVQADAEANE